MNEYLHMTNLTVCVNETPIYRAQWRDFTSCLKTFQDGLLKF